MRREKRPYSIEKRKTSKKYRYIYYVKFRNSDTQAYMTAVSSGKTSRAAAANWADEQLNTGKIVSYKLGKQTLAEYATSFWNYDTSTYIQGRLARGFHLGRSYAKSSFLYYKKHIDPTWGQSHLCDLETNELDPWALSLAVRDQLAPTTVNHILTVFRVMLDEAVRLKYISGNPMSSIKPLKEHQKQKGILTLDEVHRLLDPSSIEKVWNKHICYYLMNKLAAITGMRLGEIRGLQCKSVHKGYIEVISAWENQYGLKGAKWNSERIIPITSSVASELLSYISLLTNHEDDSLVFQGSVSPFKPINFKSILEFFYSALSRISISEQERIKRNITFHSWRHFFNSYCRSNGLADSKLRTITGHRTEQMTEHYTHYDIQDLSDAISLQNSILK